MHTRNGSWSPLGVCVALLVSAAAIVFLSACERKDRQAKDVVVVSVWAHAGQASERKIIERQLQAFDAAHGEITVRLTFLPERSYNAQVQAAAISDDLPDLLEFDAPYLANYAWQGRLQPLDALLSESVRSDLLPSIVRQGGYRRALYGVGMFDSGLGLYARRAKLEKIGVRIPTHPREAWSVEEFETVLAKLAKQDADGAVLDLKLNYPDEWFTYAFSPVLQSAGGDLIDRGDYQTANGVLNGPASVAAMSHMQRWLQQGRVDANVDDAAFIRGRVALSWAGHWEYPRYRQAFGDDLVLLPLPDFGRGSRTGQGSWVWGIPRTAKAPRQAAQLINFLLQPDQVLAMTAANGAVPATRSAVARSPSYKKGGPLHLFVQQLDGGHAVPRPPTPGYPVISSSFRQAFADIRNNTPVQQALDRAARTIDQDLRDNHGYPPRAER